MKRVRASEGLGNITFERVFQVALFTDQHCLSEIWEIFTRISREGFATSGSPSSSDSAVFKASVVDLTKLSPSTLCSASTRVVLDSSPSPIDEAFLGGVSTTGMLFDASDEPPAPVTRSTPQVSSVLARLNGRFGESGFGATGIPSQTACLDD